IAAHQDRLLRSATGRTSARPLPARENAVARGYSLPVPYSCSISFDALSICLDSLLAESFFRILVILFANSPLSLDEGSGNIAWLIHHPPASATLRYGLEVVFIGFPGPDHVRLEHASNSAFDRIQGLAFLAPFLVFIHRHGLPILAT